MKATLLLFGLLACVTISAQAPQMVNYQTVVRDNQGHPLPNTTVLLRFTIHDGSETGPVVFTENQTATTNQFGLVSVKIGQLGNLAIVNWGLGSKYLQVEADINNNGLYSDMGSAQLLSVPYALFAANSLQGATGPTGPAGSGNVSGTTNYIAKFTPNGNSVGNSIAYDNGADIGIGTTQPTGRLDIHAKSTTAYPQLRIYDDSATGYARIQYQNAGSNKYWQTYGYMHPSIINNSRFNFWNSSSGDVISITGNGRLGIGTNNPNVKVQMHDASSTSTLQLTNNLTGSLETDGTHISQDGYDFILNNYEGGNLIIKNNYFEKMRISQSGRVGIGDTQLLYKLTVNDIGNNATDATAGYFVQEGSGAQNAAIKAINGNPTNANSYAIYASASKGYGIYSTVDGNNAYGIYSISNANTGYGVAGIGQVGVYAESYQPNGYALEINGAVKASGNKFTFQTQPLTVANPTVQLNYSNQSSSDMLFVTPVNDISNHINTSCSVFWNGSTWEIQSGTNLFPSGVKFNVMVIKR